jgi:hypothetical protein
VEKDFEINKSKNKMNASVEDSKKLEKITVKHEDPFVKKIKITNKYYKALEEQIAKHRLNGVLAITKLASEGKNVISDPDFYRTALEYVKRKFTSEKGYLAAEDIVQSAAIAGVRDENLYKDAIDYILSPSFSSLGVQCLTKDAIESVCRILASVAITNQKSDKMIESGSAFKLALERVSASAILNEKRQDEKINRMVEIFEQALEAKIDPEISREMYETVYNTIKNSQLEKSYKIKTLWEITAKAIKSEGLSHTKLFTDFINYAKENEQHNFVRSIMQLLQIYKK